MYKEINGKDKKITYYKSQLQLKYKTSFGTENVKQAPTMHVWLIMMMLKVEEKTSLLMLMIMPTPFFASS